MMKTRSIVAHHLCLDSPLTEERALPLHCHASLQKEDLDRGSKKELSRPGTLLATKIVSPNRGSSAKWLSRVSNIHFLYPKKQQKQQLLKRLRTLASRSRLCSWHQRL